MNRWIAFPRRVMALGLFMSLLLFLVTGLQQARALTVLESGDFRDCFCLSIHRNYRFFVFGLLEVEHDEARRREIRRELIVFRAIGQDAPQTGTRLRVDADVAQIDRGETELYYCIKPEISEIGYTGPTIRCHGIEAPAVRYFGAPHDTGRGDIPFASLCTQPRDIYDIMNFFEDIELDTDRCYREVVDALDLIDPFQPTPGPEGCNSGNPLGLLWPTAGLVLLTRRRRTPRPV